MFVLRAAHCFVARWYITFTGYGHILYVRWQFATCLHILRDSATGKSHSLLYPSSSLSTDSHTLKPTAAMVQMLNCSCAPSPHFLLDIITFLACTCEENLCMDFSFSSSHTTYRLNEYWGSGVMSSICFCHFCYEAVTVKGREERWATVRAWFFILPVRDLG